MRSFAADLQSLIKAKWAALAVGVVLAAALAGFAVSATEAPAAGPWIIMRTYTPPPYSDHDLEVACERDGALYVHYMPERYVAYVCQRDAPLLWRLWLQTR
jgi:hypothetical protein